MATDGDGEWERPRIPIHHTPVGEVKVCPRIVMLKMRGLGTARPVMVCEGLLEGLTARSGMDNWVE